MSNSGHEFMPFHVPEIGEDEIRSVVETLRSGWLTTGPKTKTFEEDFRKYIGTRHAVAVNSGTAALHLALDATGIGPGDEVIVPTMTFTATAEVVIYLGARPILVDCEPDTLNLDPSDIERKISPRTKAIIPVHFGGQPCDMDKILAIARHHQLKVVEDAAHALPAGYKAKRVGAIGDITCFSFYVTKPLATGEGGMATTDNSEWAEKMQMMSLHGISKDAWKRYSSEGTWCYEVLFPGYKYNMTDIAAALGIEQLKKCDLFWQARQRVAAAYDKGFADLEEIETPVCRPGLQHAWHLYVIKLKLERARLNRNELIEALKEKGVGTSVHFIPLHQHPYYRDTLRYSDKEFPNATDAFQRIISLPIYPKMREKDVNRVIDTVRDILLHYRR